MKRSPSGWARFRRPAAALVLAAIPVGALAVPAHAEPIQVVVRGVITDAMTGDPLPGVCVFVEGDPWSFCGDDERTDAQGRYERTVAVAQDDDSVALTLAPAQDDPFHRYEIVTGKRQDGWKLDAAMETLAVVTGRALSDSTGEPVERACAAIVSPVPSAPGCSGADGVWRLTRVDPQSQAVVSIRSDVVQDTYVPQGVKASAAQRFAIPAGEVTTLPDTRMKDQATVVQPGGGNYARLIAVRVGRGGSDLVPAKADWEYSEWPDEGPQWSVEPGRYLLAFEAPEGDCWSPGDDDSFCPAVVPIWYPGTVDPGKAKPVDLRSGGTLSFATADPTPDYRRPLAVTVSDLPKGADVVDLVAHFRSGETFPVDYQRSDVTRDAAGNVTITARYLPEAPLKIAAILMSVDDSAKARWYGGKKFANAKVVAPGVAAITIGR